jgi:hypothetical protein
VVGVGKLPPSLEDPGWLFSRRLRPHTRALLKSCGWRSIVGDSGGGD